MEFVQRAPRSLGNSRFASVMKRCARTADNWLDRARRSVGARPRPAVLFEVYNPFGFDAQEPVVHLLAERGLVDVYVSGGVERGLAPHRIAALTRAGVHVHALRASRHRRFDAVVVTDGPLINSWRSSRHMFLHHGSGFGIDPSPYAFQMLESGEVDYLLAIHPTEALSAYARFGRRLRGHMRVVGQPKLDRLVNATHSSRALLESFGLDPARRTILFLSHWTPTSLMHTWGEAILGTLRARTEFNVLVTGHHHLWDHPARSGGVDWRARLRWIGDEAHMRLFPQTEDLVGLMTAADVAITDNTSGTLEYALLYRPIVLFRHPDFAFSELELDMLLRRTTSVFSHVNEFAAAFQQALRLESIDGIRRRELLDYCFSHVGDSSLRAAIAIEQVATSGILTETVASTNVDGGAAVPSQR
jgi:hypothetical protein